MVFSKNNVTEFSTTIKNILQNKKIKKVKLFLINFPVEYKDIVTRFSENMENHGFKGSLQIKPNSITSRCQTLDKKHKFVLTVADKFKIPDIITVY